jgi:HPt (histidine-containing phosphotransfer) domain-containing protein
VANTVIGKVTTWEEIRGELLSAAEAAAQIVEKFMAAYQAEDWQTVLDLSDMQALVTLIGGKALTNEEMLQMLTEENESSETASKQTLNTNKILSYQIGDAKEEPELMEKCNKYLEEMRQSANEELEKAKQQAESGTAEQNAEGEDKEVMSADDIAAMEYILPYLEPVTDLYSFEITATVQKVRTTYDENDNPTETTTEETTTEKLYVFRSSGRWVFDIGVIPLGISLRESSERSALRNAARSVRYAYMSALTDLDVKGVDISMFNGTHTLTSDYYENLTASETDPGAQLRYLVTQYYPEITKCKEIAVCLEDGSCLGAAVSLEQNGELKYGIWPYDDDDTSFANITEAIEAAKRLYSEQYGN